MINRDVMAKIVDVMPVLSPRGLAPRPGQTRGGVRSSPVYVMALMSLVYCGSTLSSPAYAGDRPTVSAAAGTAAAAPNTGEVALPPNVREMRDAILAAAHSGHIEELKLPIEWNELPPEFGSEPGSDPVALFKKLSADGEGREILAILANILAMPPATLGVGRDPENNTIYVWPYLAERPLGALSPAEQTDLLRLMPAAEAKSLQDKKKWSWWRLAIDAGGTWLAFMKRP
jgi:hypothetical protein